MTLAVASLNFVKNGRVNGLGIVVQKKGEKN